MPYRYATQDIDYTEFASGRVIYNLPGAPAFPVRLASEMFQRALAARKPAGLVRIYDPVCGAAYHLTALGFLHGREIGSILASDNDDRALAVAARNLGLLSPPGLDRREAQLRRMWEQYQKESHAGALASLAALRKKLAEAGHAIHTSVFHADALEPAAHSPLVNGPVDLVISDVPYGQLSGWRRAEHRPEPPLWQMLDVLRAVLVPGGVVAVAADKEQKITHPGYRRVERFLVGHRQVAILQLLQPPGR